MKHFMLNITLPASLSEEFMALIPHQRSMINRLMAENIITSYSLALDRSTLWATVRAKNEKEAINLMKSFPIADYITGEIFELSLHESAYIFIPQMSLN